MIIRVNLSREDTEREEIIFLAVSEQGRTRPKGFSPNGQMEHVFAGSPRRLVSSEHLGEDGSRSETICFSEILLSLQ